MSDAKSAPSLESMSDSTPESVEQEADDLAKDLLGILDRNAEAGSFPLGKGNRMIRVDAVALIQQLCIFMVARDHQVMRHGYDLGKASAALVELFEATTEQLMAAFKPFMEWYSSLPPETKQQIAAAQAEAKLDLQRTVKDGTIES